MLYAIISEDVADSLARRLKARPEHLGTSKNSNFFVRVRRRRTENRSVWVIHEDSSTPPTKLSRKKCVFRGAHLARIEALQPTGRLLLAGPHPAIDSENPGPAGFSGSLIVAEFASLEEAQQWADADPFVAAGVYKKVTVKPFKKVLPA